MLHLSSRTIVSIPYMSTIDESIWSIDSPYHSELLSHLSLASCNCMQCQISHQVGQTWCKYIDQEELG